ncbi:MAG: Mov34/MPN/PAD-1 family protein [Stenotrophomonas maltophilia]
MPDLPAPVEIGTDILEEIYREARNSFPAECCGWLSGARGGARVSLVRSCINDQASGNHPTVAERTAEAAYVLSGEDLLALNRSFDTQEPALVIYHSHPNGQAYLSETDRQVATSPWGDEPAYPVQQVVIGINEQRVVEAAHFAWSEEEKGFVEIARYAGAEI